MSLIERKTTTVSCLSHVLTYNRDKPLLTLTFLAVSKFPATSSETTMGIRIEASICKIIRIESKYDLGKISSTKRIKQAFSESPQPFYHEGVQEHLKDTP